MAKDAPSAALRFRKMHGLGNDFVVIDARGGGTRVTPALARALGDRHRGVGFDQLAEIVDPAELGDAQADAGLIFWNSDGSTAGACGNATRCVSSLLLAETGRGMAQIRTQAGRLSGRRRDDGLIEVNMGPPALDWAEIPLAEAVDTLALPLPGAPAAVSMGNPHCVFVVDDAEAVDLALRGPQIETHPLFPQRTNVEFISLLAPDRLRLRVWERGAGVTLACGSGACAAVVAAARRGVTGRRAEVVLDGGVLEIDWRDEGVVMAGPVASVFEAELSPSFLAALEA
ncbi:diaminopimelate epimerase [Albimonas sp. CAU 1670]|uniref:diaminopimelate epimerase n=1 Tax=Albimonas sp. CAU 1670 TaxID=3032599 RepID=UPI0023DAEEC8|nr:diaminopimelate epimerase [Albimonas sp. CAU 1670]MDF2235404.1 diaminopimelate epimerase [Albimonas sp. CAU 1670]